MYIQPHTNGPLVSTSSTTSVPKLIPPIATTESSETLNYQQMTDKLLGISMENIQSMLNESSVTSVGKWVDWLFGWRKTNQKSSNVEINQQPTATLEVKKQASSVDRVFKKASGINLLKPSGKQEAFQITKRGYYEKYPDNDILYKYYPTGIGQGVLIFEKCRSHFEPFSPYYEEWFITFDESMTTLSQQSNDPAQFAESVLKCLIKLGVPNYLTKVPQLHAFSVCSLVPGQITQQLGYFTFTTHVTGMVGWSPPPEQVVGYFADNIDNQTSILFPQDVADSCLTENMYQSDNKFPNKIKFMQNSLTCAVGSYNIKYLNNYCTRQYVLQDWVLMLPSNGDPLEVSEAYLDALNQYCTCAGPQVFDVYFSPWEKTTGNDCADLNSSNSSSLTIQLGTNGALIISSADGFFNGQPTSSQSLDNAIQQCYNNTMGAYLEDNQVPPDNFRIEVIYLSAKILGVVSVAVVFAAAINYKKIIEKFRGDQRAELEEVNEVDEVESA